MAEDPECRAAMLALDGCLGIYRRARRLGASGNGQVSIQLWLSDAFGNLSTGTHVGFS